MTPDPLSQNSRGAAARAACRGFLAASSTPSSHSKNSQSKIYSKGWVAQAPVFDR